MEIQGSYDAARSTDTEQDSSSIPQSRGAIAEGADSKESRSEGTRVLDNWQKAQFVFQCFEFQIEW